MFCGLVLSPSLVVGLLVPAPPAVGIVAAPRPAVAVPNAVYSFHTASLVAALQPDWLGAPAANSNNPGGAGNAEGVRVLEA